MGRKPQTNQTNKNPKKEALSSVYALSYLPTYSQDCHVSPLPSLKRGKGKEAVLLLIKYPCEQIHSVSVLALLSAGAQSSAEGDLTDARELLTHILKNHSWQGKESFCLALKQNAGSRAPES